MSTRVEVKDHPAKFHKALWPALAAGCWPARAGVILDPFAGVGGIHTLRDIPGFEKVETVGVEIEPEWALAHPGTRVGDATALEFGEAAFDAVCTSPAYGNRMSDQYLGESTCPDCRGETVLYAGTGDEVGCDRCGGSGEIEPTKRYGYAISLGRHVSEGSSGGLAWGPEYRRLHEAAWGEVWRVLVPGGRMVLNVKDHIRGGRRQPVTAWHVEYLLGLGFRFLYCGDVDTGSLAHGKNWEKRLPEQVWVFQKSEGMF